MALMLPAYISCFESPVILAANVTSSAADSGEDFVHTPTSAYQLWLVCMIYQNFKHDSKIYVRFFNYALKRSHAEITLFCIHKYT